MDKEISVYDNSVSARTYISYIAEQAGGFALIGRDGKIYIKTIGETKAELPIKYFKNFKLGENFKVSRVRYEDGIRVFEQGTETNNTVYVNQDNMYIVDQEQIDNMYEKIKDLDVYSFEGTSIVDPSLDMGDLLLIDGKCVIYQGSMSYMGKWQANIDSKIQSKNKEETTVRTPSQKTINRRVESRIEEAEGKIEQIVEEQSDYESKLTKVEQDVDSINQTISETVNYKRTADGVTEIYLENSKEKGLLLLNIDGNKNYEANLYPKITLYPRANLQPNSKGG